MRVVLRDGGATLYHGDSRNLGDVIEPGSIDAIVCDPPYGLSKQPDMAEVLQHWLAGDDYAASVGGFMGKAWDSFVPGPATWREVFRVLKPGGHLLAFFGSRTFDLGTLAVRLAGFEVRDALQWIYGSGFPKSLDVSKAIDKAAGAVRRVVGSGMSGATAGMQALGPSGIRGGSYDITAPATPDAARWDGWGTALKPAYEPILLARKPLAGTVAANVLEHSTGGLNIDGCRIGSEVRANAAAGSRPGGAALNMSSVGMPRGVEGREAVGRWPANVILDEAAAAVLDEQSGERKSAGPSRFFYCAKTSRADRDAGLDHLPPRSAGEATDRTDGTDGLSSPRAGAGRTGGARNTHPTVKPTALMRWLCRLVTPAGGVVLDPFAGSGSTGVAAIAEGFRFVGVEMADEYLPIAIGRLSHAVANAAAAAAELELDRQLSLLDTGGLH